MQIDCKNVRMFVFVAGSTENRVVVENSGSSKELPRGVRVLNLKTWTGFVS